MAAVLIRILICYLLPLTVWASLKDNVPDALVDAHYDGKTTSFCGFILHNSPLPSGKEDAKSYPLQYLPDWSACEMPPPHNISIEGHVVMLNRGPCSSGVKIDHIQRLKGAGLILVYTFLNTTANLTNSSAFDVKIPAVVVSELNADEMLNLTDPSSLTVSMWEPHKRLDFSHLVIWFIAIFSVSVGAFWQTRLHLEYLEQKRAHEASRVHRERPAANSSPAPPSSAYPDSSPLVFSIVYVFLLVFLMCGIIILLFYFFEYLVYGVIAVFCLASSIALYMIGDYVMKKIDIGKCRCPIIKVRGNVMKCKVRQVIWAIISVAIVLVWLIFRKESFAWMLQDLLGICFCINLLSLIKFPNLLIILVLMGLLVVYDIVFVFVSPFFTKSGESIMVHVATGGGGKETEQLPMVIRIPYFIADPMAVCSRRNYSLLGLGDILVPGILIAYLGAFDIEFHGRYIYFVVTVIAYSLGLIATFAALQLMEYAQPALLYLVPFTLASAFIVAGCRREVKALLLGRNPTKRLDVQAGVVSSASPDSSDQGVGENRRLLDNSENQLKDSSEN